MLIWSLSSHANYRKVVYKSRGYCAIFQLFGAGFYSSAAYMQSPESAKPIEAVWHM